MDFRGAPCGHDRCDRKFWPEPLRPEGCGGSRLGAHGEPGQGARSWEEPGKAAQGQQRSRELGGMSRGGVWAEGGGARHWRAGSKGVQPLRLEEGQEAEGPRSGGVGTVRQEGVVRRTEAGPGRAEDRPLPPPQRESGWHRGAETGWRWASNLWDSRSEPESLLPTLSPGLSTGLAGCHSVLGDPW